MNWKVAVVIVVVVIGVVAGSFLIFGKRHPRPPVKVVLRVSVTPGEKVGYAMDMAKSGRFKYMLGKISGAEPFLAQQLTLKAVPNSSLIEAQIRVQNPEEARTYAEAFVGVLQDLCGPQVQLALDRQTIR